MAFKHAIAAAVVAGVLGLGGTAGAVPGDPVVPEPPPEEPPPPPPPPPAPERAFQVAFQGQVNGDLLLIGNSNLRSAGAWHSEPASAADVDGDNDVRCVVQMFRLPSCSNNSSSAQLDLPAGARVVHARLYVETSLATDALGVVAQLAGPGSGYTQLGAGIPEIPKLYEARGHAAAAMSMRQAVWDVTGYVTARGAGTYTVANIVNERLGPGMPYAAWSLAVAYEHDPASGVDPAALGPEAATRFAPRVVSWHDGFVVGTPTGLEVPVTGFQLPLTVPVFAKSFHVIAHGETGTYDNLLFDGEPLGNNASPGDAPAPPGVVVGADPACNSTVDVFNDSICVLGTPVATKVPGAADFLAAHDGVTPSSASAVDMDVVRIPDRYLDPGATAATLGVTPRTDPLLAVGMLAVSIDVVQDPVVVAP